MSDRGMSGCGMSDRGMSGRVGRALQPAATKRPTLALPALAAQGFEVKAAFASYLVLQKGKDVWLCYMLQTRSSCEPAE
jgi:hypothetical protein